MKKIVQVMMDAKGFRYIQYLDLQSNKILISGIKLKGRRLIMSYMKFKQITVVNVLFVLVLSVSTHAFTLLPAKSLESDVDVKISATSERLELAANLVLNEKSDGISILEEDVIIDFQNVGSIAGGVTPCFIIAIPKGAFVPTNQENVFKLSSSDPKVNDVEIRVEDDDGNILDVLTDNLVSLDVKITVEDNPNPDIPPSVEILLEADAINDGVTPCFLPIGSMDGLIVFIGSQSSDSSDIGTAFTEKQSVGLFGEGS